MYNFFKSREYSLLKDEFESSKNQIKSDLINKDFKKEIDPLGRTSLFPSIQSEENPFKGVFDKYSPPSFSDLVNANEEIAPLEEEADNEESPTTDKSGFLDKAKKLSNNPGIMDGFDFIGGVIQNTSDKSVPKTALGHVAKHGNMAVKGAKLGSNFGPIGGVIGGIGGAAFSIIDSIKDGKSEAIRKSKLILDRNREIEESRERSERLYSDTKELERISEINKSQLGFISNTGYYG